jgi:FAD synthetase
MTENMVCEGPDVRINGAAKTDRSALTRGSSTRTLPQICFELQAKIDAFLCEETEDDVLCGVQSQVKVSMAVIQEALRRYG